MDTRSRYHDAKPQLDTPGSIYAGLNASSGSPREQ